MARRAKNELSALAKASREHLKRADMLGKSLDARLKLRREASDEFTVDEDARRDFAAITTALQHAGNSLIRALDANKKSLSGMTEDQLTAQLNSELVHSAATLSDEQWQSMVDARAKQKR